MVNRVRRILGERRVGHAGTLDPAASGVLVVGVGQATRLMGQLTLDDKRYEALVSFGTQTSTDDAEGEVICEAEVPARLAEPGVAEVVVSSLEGTCDQLPPAYSAISVEGQRAYARARAGKEVVLPTRQVTIYESRLLAVESSDPVQWRCSFHVSKGTYIRSIARDLGLSLGTAAHLAALRRTASGSIGLDLCVSLSQLEALGPSKVMECALDPVRVLGLATHELNDYEYEAVQVGRRFTCRTVQDRLGGMRAPLLDERVSLTRQGRLMGVWRIVEGRLSCEANFPQGIGGVSP